MSRKILRVVAFLLVLVLCYAAVDNVLKIKVYDMRSLITLQQMDEGTLDVVFVGSSHIGRNVDNQQLWAEHGITSYDLWAGMQPVWNSYYYLKEALNYQTPKLAVVDVFLCGTALDYSTKVVAMKNITTMPFGLNKINAAFASFERWQDAVEALWGMPYYHYRYDELTADDLAGRYGWDDEIIPTVHQTNDWVYPLNFPDYASITDTLALTEKNETYLRKIIDLCKAKNIPLLLLVAPFEATEEECMRFNTVQQIAQEEGVPCLNYLHVWDEEGIDPLSHFYDVGHFNETGIRRFTASLGNYLAENYDLPDHRTDPFHPWYGITDAIDISLQADYHLSQVFRGDGRQRYTDTGLQPFADRYGSWTLMTRIDTTPITEGDSVYLSCFDESDASNHRGLLLRQNRGRLELILGPNVNMNLPLPQGDTADLRIIKSGEEFSIYFDGQWITTGETLSFPDYDGNLLIGCQELSAQGERFRYSPTTVLNLEYYASALSTSEVEAWQPETLPEPELPLGVGIAQAQPIYTLDEQFMGNGDLYRQESVIDTGLALFNDPSTRFTLTATVLPNYLSGDNVFLSCFREQEGAYGGLLVRQTDEQTLSVVFGNNWGIDIPCQNGTPLCLTVTKDGSHYTIYADGQLIADEVTGAVDNYAGTLLLGAQTDADGHIFRQSSTQVMGLQVYAGIAEDAALLAAPVAPLPQERIAPSVTYTLAGQFSGNNTDRYVDTGAQLYATKDMSWTLDTVLRTDPEKSAGVYLSCYCEVPGQYRGLLIRQEDEELCIILGDGAAVRLPLSQGSMHLVIVKDGDDYAIYADGQLAGQATSACKRFDGTLLLGAQTDADGNLFRFSEAKITQLTVTDAVLSPDAALEQSLPVVNNSRF